MPRYEVSLTIEVDAPNPKTAAFSFMDIIPDDKWVVSVLDPNGKIIWIDTADGRILEGK